MMPFHVDMVYGESLDLDRCKDHYESYFGYHRQGLHSLLLGYTTV